MTPYRREWEHLIVLCRRIVHATCGVDPIFTSLQVNVDSIAEPHKDAYNAGWSWMLVCGSFEGGRFVTNREWDASGRLFHFDGGAEHSSTAFTGHRISLVMFTHSTAADLTWQA